MPIKKKITLIIPRSKTGLRNSFIADLAQTVCRKEEDLVGRIKVVIKHQ